MGCQRDRGEGNPLAPRRRGPGSGVLGPKSAFLPGRGPAPSRRRFLSPPPQPRMKPVASSPPRPRGDEGDPKLCAHGAVGSGDRFGEESRGQKTHGMGWVGRAPFPISNPNLPSPGLKPLPRVPAPQYLIKVTPGASCGAENRDLGTGAGAAGPSQRGLEGRLRPAGEGGTNPNPRGPEPGPLQPNGCWRMLRGAQGAWKPSGLVSSVGWGQPLP